MSDAAERPQTPPALKASNESYNRRRVPWDFDRDIAIKLSTIGSRGVLLEAKPAALREAAGGVTIWQELHDGPLALTLTRAETYSFISAMLRALVEGDAFNAEVARGL